MARLFRKKDDVPKRSLWQRVENLFFKLFPPRLY